MIVYERKIIKMKGYKIQIDLGKKIVANCPKPILFATAIILNKNGGDELK